MSDAVAAATHFTSGATGSISTKVTIVFCFSLSFFQMNKLDQTNTQFEVLKRTLRGREKKTHSNSIGSAQAKIHLEFLPHNRYER